MRLTSVAVLKWNGENQDPFFLAAASDVSNFGFFQRQSVREMLSFVSRTVVKRTLPGQRQSVQHEEYVCHVHNKDGLAGIVFVDREYPSRSAFCVVNAVLGQFLEKFGNAWRTVTEDQNNANDIAEQALAKYQDPSQADKLLKVQKELDETKVILHQTIDSVLQRGEKLDNLVDKSTDLSMASQIFYKQAKKQNQCCTIQ